MHPIHRFAAALLFVAGSVAATTASRPVAKHFAVWQTPAGYVEVNHDSPVERIYVFAPRNAAAAHDGKDWSDRVRVVAAQLPPGQRLDQWFAALRARAKQDCPGLIAAAGPSTLQGRPQHLYEMWHCPKANGDGRGEISLYKLIADGTQVYMLVAEGRYPAFAPGKTPLSKAQLARWSALENSFVLCDGYLRPSCMGDPATLSRASVTSMSDTEVAAARRAETLGRELYRQDALAWKAGVALGAQRMQGVRGWVALPKSDDSGAVYFFRGDRAKPELAWVVTLQGRAAPKVSAGTPAQLNAELATRFRARQSALAEQTKPCTPELNTAVLHDSGNGGWLVYTLAAPRDSDVVWIGGSTRYLLAPDAVTITAARPSARGCLSTHRKDATGRPIGDLVLTQSLSN
ncbi:MAG: hypothetical protein ABIY40_02790, partial [Rhodanobacteraceae bacterium]